MKESFGCVQTLYMYNDIRINRRKVPLYGFEGTFLLK